MEAVKLEDLDPEAVRAGLHVCISRVVRPSSVRWTSLFQRSCWLLGLFRQACCQRMCVCCVPSRSYVERAAARLFAERLHHLQATSKSYC